ncbi:extracellular solute-binding protein [Bifidobacterium sp.]|jgi:spermidine/putrescine transport system substrate-binding protein|uniref:extracellular solute-binding protein n=1 Tax=Bifidobacterium sp. TaxID=41200 RepID=UPI0025B88338|nr:extracellular solute-binding protein [Bifidobacterium sp.]MCI1636060.1 extracellular solute-binding protein [Bifidobacterium sp.]
MNNINATRLATTSIITLLILGGCSSGVGNDSASDDSSAVAFTPATSGELHIYTWSDYYPDDLLKSFEEDTGIKTTIDYYESNEVLMSKLQATSGSGYDVVVPSDYAVELLADEGLLQQINALDLPNGKNIEDDFRQVYFDKGRKYSAPYLYGTTGYMYDSSLLAAGETAPDSWKDYFTSDAAWNASPGIFNDQTDGVNAALRASGGEPCSTDPTELQAAQDLLTEYKKKVQNISSDSVIDRLISGENSVAMIWNGAGHRVSEQKSSMDYVYPSEGMSSYQDNWAVPSGAENVQQALTFINWMMEPENIAAAANYQGYDAGITGVDELLDDSLRNDPAVSPPDDAKIELVPTCSNEAINNYTKIWESFKS